MSTSTFRQVVAEVAARAKARLPEAVNGRVESAVKLVLGHDVEVQADGSILVGSSSDPMKQYTLQGTSCTCKDFPRAPEGWCQHRIAAGIDKRVRELLPVAVPVEPWSDNDMEGPLPELEPTPAPQPLPEAAFSLTLRGLLGGVDSQLTVRGQSAEEFYRNLAAMQDQLREAVQGLFDAPPAPPAQTPAAPQGQLSPQQFNAMAQHKAIKDVCPLHQVQMQLNTKEGRSWYSHRLADGSWCKGK